jgi:hypothetical protein
MQMIKNLTAYILLISILISHLNCSTQKNRYIYSKDQISFLPLANEIKEEENLVFYYADINCSDCLAKIITISKKIKPNKFVLLYNEDQSIYLKNLKNRLNNLNIKNITITAIDNMRDSYFKYFRYSVVYELTVEKDKYVVKEIDF